MNTVRTLITHASSHFSRVPDIGVGSSVRGGNVVVQSQYSCMGQHRPRPHVPKLSPYSRFSHKWPLNPVRWHFPVERSQFRRPSIPLRREPYPGSGIYIHPRWSDGHDLFEQSNPDHPEKHEHSPVFWHKPCPAQVFPEAEAKHAPDFVMRVKGQERVFSYYVCEWVYV